MKFERVIAVVLLITFVKAGLFSSDPKAERAQKRQEAEKKARTQTKRPPPPKAKKNALITEDDSPLGLAGIQEILADADIIDTVTQEDNPKLKNEEIYKLWEKNMHDFVPEDLTNFIVESSSATVLYEEIGHMNPTTVKGAYYVHGGTDAKNINVFVQDPNKNIIYKRSDEIQGIIMFDTTTPGEYSFIFSNLDDATQKTLTLAIHTYEDKDEQIQYSINDDGERVVTYDPRADPNSAANIEAEEIELAGDQEIGNVRNLLRGIQTASKQVQTEQMMSNNRQESLNSETIKNSHWYYWAMLIELLMFLAILIFQMKHVKNRLDNKLIL